MPYKSILVQADGADPVLPRIEIAAGIAMTEGAHLVGAACADSDASGQANTGRDRARAALERFDQEARSRGVASFERRLIDGDAAAGYSRQGRYCDLMILGQGDTGSDGPALSTDFVEYVIINCACPVLVAPGAQSGIKDWAALGERVLVAWNASSMAARAVRDAMPFLMRAGKVHVAIVNAAPDSSGTDSGEEIAAYLSKHGIDAEIIRQTVDTDAGSALLALAERLSCDLLVMGCAAHQRGRGLLIGGATRTVLQSARVAVLMSH